MSWQVSTYRNVARWVVAALVLANLVALFIEMGLGWDFANFYDAGNKIAAGEARNLYDPEALIAGQAPQGHMEFVGTPLSAVLYAPLAPLSPRAALFAFKLQNALAYLAGLWLLFRHCRRYAPQSESRQARFAALFAVLLLIYQPLWTVYRVGGQTTPTIFLLLVAGWLLHERGRLWGSALALVVVVAIKPAFVLMLALLALISGRAFLLRSAVLGLGAALLSIAVLGWPLHRTFLEFAVQLSNQSTVWVYNSALTVPIESLHLAWTPDITAPRIAGLALAVFAVRFAVVGFFSWLVLTSRRQGWSAQVRRHFDWPIAIVFCLMAAPVVWEHYLAFLFIPLAFLAANEDRISRSTFRLVLLAAFLTVFQNLVVVLWLWEQLTSAPWPVHVAFAVVKASPLLVMLALLTRHQRDILASYAFTPSQPRGL
jgi:alpha-1,2-mannosyltransferase